MKTIVGFVILSFVIVAMGCDPTMSRRVDQQNSLLQTGQISKEQYVDNLGQILEGGPLFWAPETTPGNLGEMSAYYNMQAARWKRGEITFEEFFYLVRTHSKELDQKAIQDKLNRRKTEQEQRRARRQQRRLRGQGQSSSSALTCGIRPIPKIGCRIGQCVNGRWEQVC